MEALDECLDNQIGEGEVGLERAEQLGDESDLQMVERDQVNTLRKCFMIDLDVVPISPLLQLGPVPDEILHYILLQPGLSAFLGQLQEELVELVEIQQEDVDDIEDLLVILLFLVQSLLENIIDDLPELLLLGGEYVYHLVETAQQLGFAGQVFIEEPYVHLADGFDVVIGLGQFEDPRQIVQKVVEDS